LKKGVLELHPFISNYIDSDDFQEFFYKYAIIIKELLVKSLRNKSRQRRSMAKIFEDLNIILNEANYADERILKKHNLSVK
jgi:hypothetical protein